ncbi:MAG: thiamine phosphate synthase [Myxococcales bacterium]|nr:thiamine phosphate synthase [Polyangiaceae bacterium]MDW8250750.1 thiamine phosphate synthase [Myxococcales bacterium]
MTHPIFPTQGLYALVDLTSLERCGLDPIRFAGAVIAGGPAVVQLRAKGYGARETLAMLRRLVPLCRQANVLCFANDRPDLAALSGCDGFHVGQEDLPLPEARKIAPGLLAGVSTHSQAQIDEALSWSPDYLAVGPVYPTASKENPDPVVGLDLVRWAVAQAPCPVVAIGGIDLARAPEVAAAGAVGAVVGALLPDGEDMAQATERTRSLSCALRGNHP